MTDAVSLPLKAAAAAVGLSVDVVRAACKDGTLPVHYYGSKPLILRTDLEAWVRGMPNERRSA